MRTLLGAPPVAFRKWNSTALNVANFDFTGGELERIRPVPLMFPWAMSKVLGWALAWFQRSISWANRIMEIRLRPELEELIRQDVQRAPYQTVDEFVERAVSMLHEQEAWLAEHRVEIATKIDEGYAAAQRITRSP